MRYERNKLLTIALFAEGFLFLIAILLGKYFNIRFFPDASRIIRDLIIGTVAAIIPFFVFLFTISDRAVDLPVFGSLRKTVLTEIREIFMDSKPVDLVLISAFAGLGEEALFRGIIQTKFGIVIASVVFGLVHFISPSYMLVTMLMGFYMGAFYELTGSLLIAVQIHFIYDLAALIYIKYYITEQGQ